MQFQSESESLRPKRSDGVSSSLKAGWFETQEEHIFNSSPKARKDQVSQLNRGTPQPFCSNQTFN